MLAANLDARFRRVDRIGLEKLLQTTAAPGSPATPSGCDIAPAAIRPDDDVQKKWREQCGPEAKRVLQLMKTGQVDLDPRRAITLLWCVPETPSDVFHANSIMPLPKRKGLWKEGDLLVSFRYMNLLAVFDRETMRILWSFGTDVLEGQHSPFVTEEGTILVFDNGMYRKYSRILEIDPEAKEIVWDYHAPIPRNFFSSTQGGVEVVENGDVLITDAESGRLLEITRDEDKDLVWEYFNPDVVEDGSLRAGIYRAHRFPAAMVNPVLAAHGVKPFVVPQGGFRPHHKGDGGARDGGPDGGRRRGAIRDGGARRDAE
jgi:hypothetical protein